MEIWVVVLVALASYLFGSISVPRLVARVVDPAVDLEDVRLADDGGGGEGATLRTVGATTASVRFGPRVGCTIGLLDILKGALPVLLLRALVPDEPYYLVAGVFVVVGHDWPVFHRFRGGGGLSPTYGGFLAIAPLGAVLSAVAGLVLGLVILRDMVIALISGLWFFLLWLVLVVGGWPSIVYGIAMNVIFLLALIPDTRDYRRRKRAGELDMAAGMESFPMGRGMARMMRALHIEPR